MKIIHCADLHIDSRMESNLSPEQAKLRREELMETYERMVQYAAARGVRAIMIVGDMFDKPHLRRSVRTRVLEQIYNHPEIDFLYLQGNHDNMDFLLGMDPEELPKNLKQFSKNGWTSYDYGDAVITGLEMTRDNADTMAMRLVLDAGRTNIVMLHGQDRSSQTKNPEGTIYIPDFRGRNIDYLALGHIHTCRMDRLDDRGVYCYSGCLEGRGFDECGPKGFVLLDIQDGRVSPHFVSFASRELHTVSVTLDSDDTMSAVIAKAEEAIRDIPKRDLVKIVLTGDISMDLEIDRERIERRLADHCFFVKVEDATRTQIDFASYLNDRSLKGEFVRLMRDADVSGEDRERITRIGLKALAGEELEE